MYQDKPKVALSTSPGGRGGATVLKVVTDSAKYFGGNIKGSLAVASFYDNFDQSIGALTNPELAKELRETVLELKTALS